MLVYTTTLIFIRFFGGDIRVKYSKKIENKIYSKKYILEHFLIESKFEKYS